MIDCISVENMRQSDRYTIENCTESKELMYRAAFGVFQSVSWHGRIAIVTGSGNNGGDGFALACILKDHGFDCDVLTLGRRLSVDSQFYAERANALGIRIKAFDTERMLSDYDFVVDCLLGTGFQGEIREDYRRAIEAINSSDAFVISVDINSGLNGDTGEAEIAVMSDLTITVGYVKNGLMTRTAGEYMKRLLCVDIGIVLVRKENLICTPSEWAAFCNSEGIDPSQSKAVHDGRIYYRCPDWLEV